MKSKFSGYYKYSDDELNSILSESVYTLDYSFLLDINTLSHGRLILDILQQYSDRLWLPYDTAWMYHQKIKETIEDQIKRVITAKKYLTSFKHVTDDAMNHPYIAEELKNKYDLLMKLTIEALDKESKYLTNSLVNSDIKTKILNLFEGKVGEEYNSSELKIIYEEGAEMNKRLAPPCVNLITSDCERERFHYYIIWKQIQKKVIEDNDKSVIFITNKLTENWFLNHRNKFCVTSPILRTEFERITNKSIICMSAHYFVRKCRLKTGNPQEYEKLLLQLNKTPEKTESDYTEISNYQI